MLNRFFKLSAHGTTTGRELQAGLATFAAMAYILAVNPSILMAGFGVDPAIGTDPASAGYIATHGALVTVTAITAALATIIMALMTNYPLALAPGMGINAFFAFSICLGAGILWHEALGMVFVNGFVFLLLSLTGVREKVIRALPHSLKLAVTAGIGLFIAFIGLRNAGVIVPHPATLVSYGDFSSGSAALCLAGIVLTGVLIARRIPGAIVISIAAITVAGLFVVDGQGGTITPWPAGIFSVPASPAPVFLKLSFGFLQDFGAFMKALPFIFALLMVDMFDNIGSLIGVTTRAGLTDSEGNLPKAGRALVADSIAAMLSALNGTSTVVTYIESASGVEAGGRTGLTTITTAFLFLAALFLTPLILIIPAAATAPALVAVGVLMLQAVTRIDFDDFLIALPAALVVIGIPLTFSIAEGIGLGMVAAAVLALGTGRPRSLPITGYIIAMVFFLKFFHMFPFST
ncbi:MAG: NCS2 family permease [Opitutaceae bacterium]|jgi:AGZA family xanthine/uracil permease-like MFS transporter